MEVIGIDFTSSPSRKKPITALRCRLEGDTLTARKLESWPNFKCFEEMLVSPGPWIVGIDFPFGQARQFIENIGWPTNWVEYVGHVQGLDRSGFRKTLDEYRAKRPFGDKEHRRATDRAAQSISPQKLYGIPVGLMFFEGAPRLLRAGVTIPHVLSGALDRIAVESYPGVMARKLIGRRPYKNDTKSKQTTEQYRARQDLFRKLLAEGEELYGLKIEADPSLCDDPGADTLDALLCSVQAAWAWSQRRSGYGAPNKIDALEGWIADPMEPVGTPKPELKKEPGGEFVMVNLTIRRRTLGAARTIAQDAKFERPGFVRGDITAEEFLSHYLDTHIGD